MVRIVTFAVLAAVVFMSALVLSAKLLYDLDLAVAGSPFYRWLTPWPGDVSVPWENEDLAPLGSVMLGGDGDNALGDYIPLLGFAWWFGPFGVIPFLAGGLAIVSYSRRPRVPGSYLTGRMLAVGAALVLFGMAAALPLGCMMIWTFSCSTPEGGFLFLALGGLLLGFAISQRRWLLAAAAGGVIGLVAGIAGGYVMERLIDWGGYGLGWLAVTTGAGAGAGAAIALAASRRRSAGTGY